MSISVEEAIVSRRSIRAFLAEPVPPETISRILEISARAPSGTNMQPWQAVVLTGVALKEFTTRLEAVALSGERGTPSYRYYPKEFREPYLSRRRKVGWDLYTALGIQRGESEKMARQHAKNMTFFDAPVGIIFTIDADLELGSWLDYGMFLQNVMIAARGFGLDTCPQAAFATFNDEIQRLLGLPTTRKIVCGMALGKADLSKPENNFSTERAPVSEFTQFLSTLPPRTAE